MAVVLRQYSQPLCREQGTAEDGACHPSRLSGSARWEWPALKVFQSPKPISNSRSTKHLSLNPAPPLFSLRMTQVILSSETTVDLGASLERKFHCEPEGQRALTAEKKDRQKEQKCLRFFPLLLFGISKISQFFSMPVLP